MVARLSAKRLPRYSLDFTPEGGEADACPWGWRFRRWRRLWTSTRDVVAVEARSA